MKRLLIALTALCAALTAAAQTTDTAILARLASSVRSMEPYEIKFTVSSSDAGSSKGTIIVDRDRYAIEIDGEHQFSDGSQRYNVSPLERVVTVDRLNPSSRNILENPSRAFAFDAGSFTSRVVSTDDDAITLDLIPAAGVLDGIDFVALTIDAATYLPRRLVYDLGGSKLTISVDSFESIRPDEQVFEFDTSRYDGYEVISFVD